MIVEPYFSAGTRLIVEFNRRIKDWPVGGVVQVRYSNICIPSLRKGWLTGCSLGVLASR